MGDSICGFLIVPCCRQCLWGQACHFLIVPCCTSPASVVLLPCSATTLLTVSATVAKSIMEHVLTFFLRPVQRLDSSFEVHPHLRAFAMHHASITVVLFP